MEDANLRNRRVHPSSAPSCFEVKFSSAVNKDEFNEEEMRDALRELLIAAPKFKNIDIEFSAPTPPPVSESARQTNRWKKNGRLLIGIDLESLFDDDTKTNLSLSASDLFSSTKISTTSMESFTEASEKSISLCDNISLWTVVKGYLPITGYSNSVAMLFSLLVSAFVTYSPIRTQPELIMAGNAMCMVVSLILFVFCDGVIKYKFWRAKDTFQVIVLGCVASVLVIVVVYNLTDHLFYYRLDMFLPASLSIIFTVFYMVAWSKNTKKLMKNIEESEKRLKFPDCVMLNEREKAATMARRRSTLKDIIEDADANADANADADVDVVHAATKQSIVNLLLLTFLPYAFLVCTLGIIPTFQRSSTDRKFVIRLIIFPALAAGVSFFVRHNANNPTSDNIAQARADETRAHHILFLADAVTSLVGRNMLTNMGSSGANALAVVISGMQEIGLRGTMIHQDDFIRNYITKTHYNPEKVSGV